MTQPLRINEQLFLNDNIFVKGLMTKVTMFEPDTDPTDGTDRRRRSAGRR